MADAKLTLLEKTPLVTHLFTIMRDEATDTQPFVLAANRITHMLIDKALCLLPAKPTTVKTPCGTYQGTTLPKHSDICAVSILRAADCMLGVARDLMPGCSVGKILIQRDETTSRPKLIYSKLPPGVAQRHVLLFDPMLATGGSAIEAVRVLTAAGVHEAAIIFVNIVCCDEGLAALAAACPGVRVVTAEVDPVLNENKYIEPGLGDFGDRYFGT